MYIDRTADPVVIRVFKSWWHGMMQPEHYAALGRYFKDTGLAIEDIPELLETADRDEDIMPACCTLLVAYADAWRCNDADCKVDAFMYHVYNFIDLIPSDMHTLTGGDLKICLYMILCEHDPIKCLDFLDFRRFHKRDAYTEWDAE